MTFEVHSLNQSPVTRLIHLTGTLGYIFRSIMRILNCGDFFFLSVTVGDPER